VRRNVGNLHESYKIGKKIGDGAFGKVCLAIHRVTNDTRAVKTIAKQGIE
jgi:serine/threonine protein kinase